MFSKLESHSIVLVWEEVWRVTELKADHGYSQSMHRKSPIEDRAMSLPLKKESSHVEREHSQWYGYSEEYSLVWSQRDLHRLVKASSLVHECRRRILLSFRLKGKSGLALTYETTVAGRKTSVMMVSTLTAAASWVAFSVKLHMLTFSVRASSASDFEDCALPRSNRIETFSLLT